MAGRLKFLVPGVALLMAGPALAQLADPTKPPLGLDAPVDPAGTPAQPAGGLQLIRGKTGKPTALINGEVVELGGRTGDARLVRIDEDSVVLKGPEGEEVLYLTPAAGKKVGAGGTANMAAKATDKGGRMKKGAE